MSLTRLYIPADLGAHATLACTPDQAHYLRHVLRLEAGADIELFNGRDGTWRARYEPLGKRDAQLRLGEAARTAQRPVPDLWLLAAPLRQNRFDMLVEKATELGVARIQPVLTERTSVRATKPERLRSIAIEAAEQCERDAIPEIGELTPLAQILGAWDAARPLLVADETGGGQPAAKLLSGLALPLALLVGPEGGWSPAELALLRRCDFVRAFGLGPRILRAETAGIAALSCILALCGDWDEPPRFGAVD